MQVDFNSDLGESFGLYSAGSDAEVLPYITSANIACGFHAGDAPTMGETVARAKALGVAVGAHPGLPDLQGFGFFPAGLPGADGVRRRGVAAAQHFFRLLVQRAAERLHPLQ